MGRAGGVAMGMMLAAAVLAWALVPTSSRVPLHRLDSQTVQPSSTRRGFASPLMLAAAVGVFVTVWTGKLGFGIAAAVATGATMRLVLAARRRALARRGEQEVAQAANLLATLLRSGQIPVAALQAASEDFDVLKAASQVSSLGGDVAESLQSQSQSPGCGGMQTIASAWRVSERSGAPVAGVLARVAEALRHERRTREAVDAELASARASGQMMAALPVVAVGLGFFAGVNTLDFLAHQALGQWLVAAATVLTAVGVLWIDRLAAR